ncbi:hypothetical protein [Echinicola vietnamensis]|uniref:Uncharacterized protein n=1 Tax=Echinicola vietnamensis (strain DSM 17526 / LMG 23754 / KMM 6221) TaxID=926556 RepID=L0G6Q3_ECHVK|nr:hypothetical protein [Echinicola vietnamensis]AGA80681.1 hypothetical protein Echvi_4507 [Echinicola vietnamensis DSM 17526]
MKSISGICVLAFFTCIFAFAQEQSAIPYQANDSMMVTVVLRHLQENPVDSIQTRIMKQGFYEKINRSHARILSWNVVMGIGQIITLRFKPEYTRAVNQVFKCGAWGGFRTEFYPTYDFMPIYPVMLEKEKKLNSEK